MMYPYEGMDNFTLPTLLNRSVELYGEKKVLEQARKLLVTEVALAEGAKEAQVVQRLENIFH